MSHSDADVIVVGAGAAGIMAAWRAASLGVKVVLVEKTQRIGTKILVSGGGKCNVAHAGPLEEVLRAFRPNEGRFIRPACYRLRNDQIVEMMTSRGLRVYTRPDGRVFPVDQTAKDVVAILRGYLEEAGVEIRFGCAVTDIVVEHGQAVGIRYKAAREAKSSSPTDESGYRARTAKNLLKELGTGPLQVGEKESELRAKSIVICPGGSSYPNSGTTGDGWVWMRALGHSIERPHAALAPIYLERSRDSLAEWSGVSLRDVVLRARHGKEIARWRGDLLFTHQGVSGPAALGISRVVAEQPDESQVGLEIDFFPDDSFENVSERLLAYANQHPARRISGFFEAIPERLIPFLLESSAIAEDMVGAKFDRKARNRLATVLKGWPLGQVRHVPLEKGEVVAGGVSLDEVDPKTLASRKISGLFLCGEVLDVAGPVGGYNLQSAFATGYLAGESAADFVRTSA